MYSLYIHLHANGKLGDGLLSTKHFWSVTVGQFYGK